jgi:hypothetical protein
MGAFDAPLPQHSAPSHFLVNGSYPPSLKKKKENRNKLPKVGLETCWMVCFSSSSSKCCPFLAVMKACWLWWILDSFQGSKMELPSIDEDATINKVVIYRKHQRVVWLDFKQAINGSLLVRIGINLLSPAYMYKQWGFNWQRWEDEQ